MISSTCVVKVESDPEDKTRGDTTMVSFKASSRRYQGPDKPALFTDLYVNVWGKGALSTLKNFREGDFCLLTGELTLRKAKEGERRFLVLDTNRAHFVPGSKDSKGPSANPGGGDPQGPRPATSKGPAADDEDIPF